MDGIDFPTDWPNRAIARRLRLGPHRWWVADSGPPGAPALLFLHGLGASSHSFRNLAPLLAPWRLILPDLPGQGGSQTSNRSRITMDAIASDVAALCHALDAPLAGVIGHSAGAAIALRMAQDHPDLPIVTINAALGHFEGAAGLLFPMLAQGLAAMPFSASAFARLWGNAASVDRLLDGTGSRIDDKGRAQYLFLVRQSAHVRGALDMMAQWKLDPLLDALPSMTNPVLLIAAQGDTAVPARLSSQAAKSLKHSRLELVPGGHLLHEENAPLVAALVREWFQEQAASAKIMLR